jgi:hypothetical protein
MGWKAMSDALLSHHCCAFHRNVEISSRYAWLYTLQPVSFKWAALAAIASHQVRLALFPFRLDKDRTGYVDIPRSLGRRKLLLTEDVNTIRETNNAIFNDIFWVHLAYLTAEDGLACLRGLLRPDAHYAPVLAGFEAIDQGRRVLADTSASAEARRGAEDLVWAGNVALLEHEQRALVQPNFDRLSCAFARLVSMGSTTTFEVRGVRQELASLRSTSTRSHEASRTRCRRRCGRGLPALTTAGVGSRRALSPDSGDSMPTCARSTPACAASSTKRATTRTLPVSCPTSTLAVVRDLFGVAVPDAGRPPRDPRPLCRLQMIRRWPRATA